MRVPRFRLSLLFLWMIVAQMIAAGACKVPFSITFPERDRSTTSMRVKWSDGNSSVLGWEIEVVPRNAAPTGIPSYPLFTTRDITLSNLTPSTAYNLYIRTVCSPGQTSEWNVAIPFTTLLSNPTQCQVHLPLKDNNTETYLIDNKDTGILGKDIFLLSVDLVIEHDWPADLKITLESPQGQSLVLASHQGTVTDDFGDITDQSCTRVTRFSPDACQALKDYSPPFIGTFSTEGQIRQWKPDTLSKGPWKLIITDRALKDVGVLKFVRLNFSRQSCLPPENFAVNFTDANQINLQWDAPGGCKTVKVGVRVNGVPMDTIFIECSEEIYLYRNLLPDTEYEFFIVSICDAFVQSSESCRIKTKTRCHPLTLLESFDSRASCGEGCASRCGSTGNLWSNLTAGDTQDWLVWQGKTDTENTGPDDDVNQAGKYIYIENNPGICAFPGKAVLQSSCLDIHSNPSACDLSFSYHMFGNDIDSLFLEISPDNGETWHALFQTGGNQGNKWQQAVISLAEYDNQKCVLRFTATAASGPLGDIALDDIAFFGTRVSVIPIRYYADRDGDGTGSGELSLDLCQSVPPPGYVLTAGDCDDNDATIHPRAPEITCNGRDDNCNGLDDDQNPTTGIRLIPLTTGASCNGSEDGSIRLEISGGIPPYSVAWANGLTGDTIGNLPPGFYSGIVTDSSGCIFSIPVLEIESQAQLNIVNTGLVAPTCQGKTDGAIFIEHNTDFPPYTYQWSDGSTTKYLTETGEGVYAVTVTDANHCFSVLKNLVLNAKPSLTTNIKKIAQPLCYGQSTGQVELITINGLPPYQYVWNHGPTGAAVSNLSEGTYTCTITDALGCRQSFPVAIKPPAPIEISVISTEDVRCFGEKNGSVKTNVKGGKAPYTYFWNHFEFTDDLFELAAGEYTLTVTDAQGCRNTSQPIVIRQPEPLELTIDSLSAATCRKGANGTILARATGGNGGYNFLWSHSDQNVSGFSNLTPGIYSITTYDQFGCKTSIPGINVDFVNTPLILTAFIRDSIRCHQIADGSIVVGVGTGKSPFDLNWSHGLQYFSATGNDTLQSLKPGSYQLTVTDSEGCTGQSEILQLTDKPAIIYQLTELRQNTCAGDAMASFTVKVDGGTPPIQVTWNNGAYSGTTLQKLGDGIYQGKATDQLGCVNTFAPILLTPLSDLQIQATIRNATAESSTGGICLELEGGIPPYAFAWSNGSTSGPCLSELSPGNYFVTITDGFGCLTTGSFVVEKANSSTETQTAGIVVTPNPAFDKIKIQTPWAVQRCRIFTGAGQLVAPCEEMNFTDASACSLDVSCLPSGLYFIQVISVYGHKVVVPVAIVK